MHILECACEVRRQLFFSCCVSLRVEFQAIPSPAECLATCLWSLCSPGCPGAASLPTFVYPVPGHPACHICVLN